MRHEKIINEYESKVDSSRRITLRKARNTALYEHYKTIHLEDGTIIHKPLVLTSPENVISVDTMATIDKTVRNLKKKKVGKTFDASQYKDLFDDEDER
jgi:hypothetical protein